MLIMKLPKILVVDSEPDICRLIALVLQEKGFSVLTANDAVEAMMITQAHHGEIGLLITEVRMPLVNGPTLARALSMDEPHMPVLFMSSDYNERPLGQLQNYEFLEKPFSIDMLLKEVEVLMSEAVHELVN